MASEIAQRREDDEIGDEKPKSFYVTRRIDAGHILQAVISIVVSIGFVIGVYIFILGRIADHDGQLLVLKQAVQADKEYIQRVDEAQRSIFAEIRGKIDRLLEQNGDIRERLGGVRSDAARGR